jgi:hypothetical protein
MYKDKQYSNKNSVRWITGINNERVIIEERSFYKGGHFLGQIIFIVPN